MSKSYLTKVRRLRGVAEGAPRGKKKMKRNTSGKLVPSFGGRKRKRDASGHFLPAKKRVPIHAKHISRAKKNALAARAATKTNRRIAAKRVWRGTPTKMSAAFLRREGGGHRGPKRAHPRPRDAKGHFLSATTLRRRAAAKRAAKKRTSMVVAHSSKMVRATKPTTKRKTKVIHVPKRRKLTRRVSTRTVHKVKRRARVQQESTMAKSRKKSRAAKSRPRDAKGHFLKSGSAKRRKRGKRHHAAASPVKRKRARRSSARRRTSHRRRPTTAIVKGRRRSRSGRTTPVNVRISMQPTRKQHRRRSHRSREVAYAAEYPLSNPLSAGEMTLLGFTGLLGYGAADLLGRFLQTGPVAAGATQNTRPAGQPAPNDVVTMAMPNLKSIGGQAGLVVLSGGAAYFIHAPLGRAAVQGIALGSALHLFGDLFKSLMAKVLGTTNIGNRLYLAEIEAQTQVNTGKAQLASGAISGAPKQLRDPGPVARIHAIPQGRGVGAPPVTPATTYEGLTQATYASAVAENRPSIAPSDMFPCD